MGRARGLGRTSVVAQGGGSGGAPARRWTRALVEQELVRFAEELGYRPGDRDFKEHGQQALASAMSYHGGRGSYRDLISHLPGSPRNTAPGRRTGRPPGSGHWDDILIWQELTAYTDGMTEFPSARQMDRDGQSGLRSAMGHAGGMARWSGLIRLPLAPGQDRWPYSEENAIQDARELINQVGWLPGKAKARELGYARFATYLARDFRGGSRAFVERYSEQLERSPGPQSSLRDPDA